MSAVLKKAVKLNHSLARSLSHSLTHSLARSLARSLTHSLTRTALVLQGFLGDPILFWLSFITVTFHFITCGSSIYCRAFIPGITNSNQSQFVDWKQQFPTECPFGISSQLGYRQFVSLYWSAWHRTYTESSMAFQISPIILYESWVILISRVSCQKCLCMADRALLAGYPWYVSVNLVIIGSGNGLLSVWCQTVI